MITHKQLPTCKLPQTGPIIGLPAQYIGPMGPGVLTIDGGYLYFDNNPTLATIAATIDKNDEVDVQIVYRAEGNPCAAVKIPAQSIPEPTWSDVLFGWMGKDHLCAQIYQQRHNAIEKTQTGEHAFPHNANWPLDWQSDDIATNMSVVIAGQKLYQTISINNIGDMPMRWPARQSTRIITLRKYSREKQKEIRKGVLDSMELIQKVSPFKEQRGMVHTITDDQEMNEIINSEVLDIDISIILESSISMEDLTEQEFCIREAFSAHGIALYTPTNTQRQQIVAMMPGMAGHNTTLHRIVKRTALKTIMRVQ